MIWASRAQPDRRNHYVMRSAISVRMVRPGSTTRRDNLRRHQYPLAACASRTHRASTLRARVSPVLPGSTTPARSSHRCSRVLPGRTMPHPLMLAKWRNLCFALPRRLCMAHRISSLPTRMYCMRLYISHRYPSQNIAKYPPMRPTQAVLPGRTTTVPMTGLIMQQYMTSLTCLNITYFPERPECPSVQGDRANCLIHPSQWTFSMQRHEIVQWSM